MMDIGNNLASTRKVMTNVGNDPASTRDITTNVGNGYIRMYCKFGLGMSG